MLQYAIVQGVNGLTMGGHPHYEAWSHYSSFSISGNACQVKIGIKTNMDRQLEECMKTNVCTWTLNSTFIHFCITLTYCSLHVVKKFSGSRAVAVRIHGYIKFHLHFGILWKIQSLTISTLKSKNDLLINFKHCLHSVTADLYIRAIYMLYLLNTNYVAFKMMGRAVCTHLQRLLEIVKSGMMIN